MKKLALLVALMGVGCATVLQSVRPADLDAWRGVSSDELVLHPLFSTIPKKVEPLSNGGELWTYSNCNSGFSCIGPNCFDTSACCYNQFMVRNSTVESYRAVGRCYTDCSVRPASRQCGAPSQQLTAQSH